MNKLQPIEFAKKEQLKQMLEFVGHMVSKTGEYNLYLHKVYDFDENGRSWNGRTCRTNMFGIFKYGLSKSKYSSVQQTSVFSGIFDESSADKVLNYNYPWPTTEQIILIMAIPKNVKINGFDVNFSTPIYKFAEFDAMRYDHSKSQYTMPYDALKQHSVDLPFIVGSIVTHLPTETPEEFEKYAKYEMYINPTHISRVSENEREQYLSELSNQVITKFGIVETDDEKAIDQKIHSVIEDMDKTNFNEGSYSSDYDFD